MKEAFLEYLKHIKRYSLHTISAYEKDIDDFEHFILSESLAPSLESVSRVRLVRYYISDMQTRKLKTTTISRRISSLRMFYDYLVEHTLLSDNPFQDIQAPKLEKKLPERLHDEDIELIFASMDLKKPLSFRNYVMFDMLYSCGLRASEVTQLEVKDIKMDERQLVITGKGQKTRIVPFTKTLQRNLKHYITYIRPSLLKLDQNDHQAVFLSRLGQQMTVRNLQKMLNQLIKKSGETFKIHPHMLRHAFASTMLSHGADLRSVQELLGHKHISTTQIYTHLTTEEVLRAYQKSHPRSEGSKDKS
ncbi:MAG: tyrosine-type recombinase/integrase [Acholeplasmataceae bacterium]